MFSKIISYSLVSVMAVQLAACGTIFYPERKNQRATSNLDGKVVALDTIGLLFFLVPGIIAFAIDYSNNTIYLPRGEKGLFAMNTNDMRAIQVADGNMSNENVERIVEEYTAKHVDLSSQDVIKARADS